MPDSKIDDFASQATQEIKKSWVAKTILGIVFGPAIVGIVAMICVGLAACGVLVFLLLYLFKMFGFLFWG